MCNPHGMNILHRIEYLYEELCCFLLLQSLFELDVTHKVALFGKLHDHIDLFARFDDLIQANNTAMRNSLENCDFSTDAFYFR